MNLSNKKHILISFAALAVVGLATAPFATFKKDNSELSALPEETTSVPAPSQSIHQQRTFNIEKEKSVSTDSEPNLATTNHDTTTQREQLIARKNAIAQQNVCPDSNIHEAGYITEAYNQNNMDLETAHLQIIYQMQTCNVNQVTDIVNKIFSDSNDVKHSMTLVLDILPKLRLNFSVVNAISQQNFSDDEMKDLIALTEDQPSGIKQALIPSIVRNDSLDNLLTLTQQESFLSSQRNRSDHDLTKEESDQMVLSMILSQRNNIQIDGSIYNHLLENHPNTDTQNTLTKLAFTTNQ